MLSIMIICNQTPIAVLSLESAATAAATATSPFAATAVVLDESMCAYGWFKCRDF